MKIAKIDLEGHVSGQGMSCAGKARVICSESHFHHVQKYLIHFAFLDQALRRFFDGGNKQSVKNLGCSVLLRQAL